MEPNNSRFFQKALKLASRILGDKNRTRKMLEKADEKVQNDEENRPKGLLEKVKVMIRLIRAYINGSYRTVPWETIVKVLASLMYFLMPLDLIPDLVPVTGLVDDLALIVWVWNSVENDLEAFLKWESSLSTDDVY